MNSCYTVQSLARLSSKQLIKVADKVLTEIITRQTDSGTIGKLVINESTFGNDNNFCLLLSKSKVAALCKSIN